MTSTANSAAPPLRCRSLSRWFGHVVAVNDLTFDVTAGITGLLGPNGAGKTTLLQLAAGLVPPSGGTVEVFGQAPWGQSDVYTHVALVPEAEAVPGMLTPRAFVRGRAAMLGMAHPDDATEQALARVDLLDVQDRAMSGFSKGMRQRAKLAAALVHEPRLVLLDEPFNGLDPRQRGEVLRVLEAQADLGVAVVFSSHILEEIEGVATRVLVMMAGRLAASGDHRELRRLMTDRPHTIHIRSDNNRALAQQLVAHVSVVAVSLDGAQLTVRVTDHAAFARALPQVARAAEVCVHQVRPADESLEHVFTYLVQR